jgi:hypothetical protein
MSLRSGSRNTTVTPEQQEYAARKSFRSSLRGEDAAPDESPILTAKAHKSLQQMRQINLDSNTVTQGREKVMRKTANFGTTSNLSDMFPADNGAAENDDEMRATTTNVDDSAFGNKSISTTLNNNVSRIFTRVDNHASDSTPYTGDNISPTNQSTLKKPLIGNTENYSGSKGSHLK